MAKAGWRINNERSPLNAYRTLTHFHEANMRNLLVALPFVLFLSSTVFGQLAPPLKPPQAKAFDVKSAKAEKVKPQATQLEIVALKYLSAQDAAETIDQALESEHLAITPHHIGNQLILRGDKETIAAAKTLIEKLDQTTQLYKFECLMLTLTGEPPTEVADSSEIAGLPSGSLLSKEEAAAIAKGEVEAVIADLKKSKRLISSQRVHVAAGENNPGVVQLGSQKAVRSGSTLSRTGGRVSNYQFQDVGTMVKITARSGGGDKVIAEVNFEASSIDHRVDPEAEGDDRPGEVSTTTSQTTVTGQSGEYIVFAGLIAKSNDETRQMLLLLRPTIIKP